MIISLKDVQVQLPLILCKWTYERISKTPSDAEIQRLVWSNH